MVDAVGVAQEKPRVVHVFVALADNQHQGIAPAPKRLGNGDDEQRNLYWGACRDREIKQSIADFFSAAAGQWKNEAMHVATSKGQAAEVAGTPSLAVYVA